MRVLLSLFLVCVALAFCQAAVRRATHCVIAEDCGHNTCEDQGHHWACIHNACDCRSHDTSATTAPSHHRPHVGSSCKVQRDCKGIEHCEEDSEHCFDGFCACTSGHHHG